MYQLSTDRHTDAVADYSTDLPPMPSSVPKARVAVRGQLAQWQADAHSDAAELLVTELVTNALRHAPGSSIRLTLSVRHGKIHCDVQDNSPAPPIAWQAHGQDENGRGLLLVQHLSDRWGCRQTYCGKAVWFEIDARPTSH